jgi:hypothetical protein
MRRVPDTFAAPEILQSVFIKSRGIGTTATCCTCGTARQEGLSSSRGIMIIVPAYFEPGITEANASTRRMAIGTTETRYIFGVVLTDIPE